MITTATKIFATQKIQKQTQATWQRVILLCVLGYEAAGCLLGGSLLLAAPDGKLMDMPVTLMHGAFHDFLIPGIILTGLGILNTVAFITVIRKARYNWFFAFLALGGLVIWFWIEIAILQRLHWLHFMWGVPVLVGSVLAFALIPSRTTVIRKVFLICGMISSLLYVVINIIVAMQWEGYSISSQTVSELSAIGAPTRALWMVLCTANTLLMIVFLSVFTNPRAAIETFGLQAFC